MLFFIHNVAKRAFNFRTLSIWLFYNRCPRLSLSSIIIFQFRKIKKIILLYIFFKFPHHISVFITSLQWFQITSICVSSCFSRWRWKEQILNRINSVILFKKKIYMISNTITKRTYTHGCWRAHTNTHTHAQTHTHTRCTHAQTEG